MTKKTEDGTVTVTVENQDGQALESQPELDSRIVELARKLGISNPANLLTVAQAFTEALTVEERDFESVRQAIVDAIGEYRGFTVLTVANKDGELTVERNVGKVRKATNGNHAGGYQGSGQSFEGKACTLTEELRDKYQLTDLEYKSRRQLAHAIAAANGKEPPADNAVPRWLKKEAQDVFEHIGSPSS